MLFKFIVALVLTLFFSSVSYGTIIFPKEPDPDDLIKRLTPKCDDNDGIACKVVANAYRKKSMGDKALETYLKACRLGERVSCYRSVSASVHYKIPLKGITKKELLIKSCSPSEEDKKKFGKLFYFEDYSTASIGCKDLYEMTKNEKHLELSKLFANGRDANGGGTSSLVAARLKLKVYCNGQFEKYIKGQACYSLSTSYYGEKEVAEGIIFSKKSCELGFLDGCLDSFKYSRNREQQIPELEKACGLKHRESCKYYFIFLNDRINTDKELKKRVISNLSWTCSNSFVEGCFYYHKSKGDLSENINVFKEFCEQKKVDGCKYYSFSLIDNKNKKLTSEQKSLVQEYLKQDCYETRNGATSCNLLGLSYDSIEHEEAQKAFEKGCRLMHPTACYNLSCIFSRKNDTGKSMRYLVDSMLLGFRDYKHISRNDKDLENLRKSKNWNAFLDSIEGFWKKIPEDKILLKQEAFGRVYSTSINSAEGVMSPNLQNSIDYSLNSNDEKALKFIPHNEENAKKRKKLQNNKKYFERLLEKSKYNAQLFKYLSGNIKNDQEWVSFLKEKYKDVAKDFSN